MFKAWQLVPSKAAWMRVATCVLACLLLLILPRIAFAGQAGPGWRAGLNVKQLFEAGGLVGIVLAALSVARVALIIEHVFSLRGGALNPRKLAEQVHQLMQERQFKIAAKLSRDDGSLVGAVLTAGLAEVGAGTSSPSLVAKAMEDA